MSRTVTLTSLQNQVLQKADMVGTTFIDTTIGGELTGYINASITELQDILIQKFGDDYYFSTSTISLDGINSSYTLPADFYKLLGVDLNVSSSWAVTLMPYMFGERNRYKEPISLTLLGSTNIRYHVQGNSINFIPLPSGGQTITLYYVPVLGALASGTDTLDGVNGYEEYVIVDAAIKCLNKEESDTAQLERAKEALLKRIEAAAENRDAGMQFRVTDVTRNQYPFAGYSDVP